MIRLRLLGSLELRAPDGSELRAVLAQPRRVALLAYLTVAGRQDHVRRDTLLAVFWGESDVEHARGALRNAVHFLRRALGPEALQSRTPEELRVEPTAVWCDAVAFEHYLDTGATETALELYRGDLLEGFFVADAPEFERWVETERARLRQRAMHAAWRLADEAEDAGQAERAASFARRAVALARDDEGAIRRLIALLDRLGDRAGALRAYDQLARELAREYGVEPAPETQELVRAVRERSSVAAPRTPAPAPPHPPPAPEPAPAPEPTPAPEPGTDPEPAAVSPAPPRRRRARTRRRLAPIVLVLALLGVLGAGAARWLLGRPEARADGADLVAVLPFAYHGGPTHAYLSEGMTSLLAANLNGAGVLRAVEPRAVLAAVEGDPAVLDAARGREVAGRFGAGLYVLGEVAELGDRLRVTARLYDRGQPGHVPVAESMAEGREAELFALVDRVSAALLGTRQDAPLARTAAATTTSLPALKWFLQGERAMRAGRYGDAADAYARAVADDSLFALAHYRLSGAAAWASRSRLSLEASRRALQLAGRLSFEDSLLVAAWEAHLSARPSDAEPIYRRVLAMRPHDVEAWVQLGELLFHWGPTLGRPADEARAAFERVVALEPRHAPALVHLARLASREGRVDELRRLVERVRALGPEAATNLELEALLAFAGRDSAARADAVRDVVAAEPGTARQLLARLVAFTPDPTALEPLARRLSAPGRPLAARADAQLVLLQILLASGRWPEVRAALDTAQALPPARRAELRAAWTSLPFVSPSRAVLERTRRELAATDAAPTFPATSDPIVLGSGSYPPLLWNGVPPAPRHYLLGVLALRLGDEPGVDAALRALARLPEEYRQDLHGQELASLLRARRQLALGDAAGALAALGAPRVPADSTFGDALGYARGDARHVRARALLATGDTAAGAAWLAAVPDPAGFDLPYLVPSLLERARILEATGARDEASALRARARGIWRGELP